MYGTRKTIFAVLALGAVVVIAAAATMLAGQRTPEAAAASGDGGFAAAMRGRKLYAEHCARCHGQSAEGAPNWHVPDSEGRYPPPPLNGTAHAWHHPRAQLETLIAGGGLTMPAFGDQLDARQVADLVTYISSLWPDEIFEAWQRANERAAGTQ